MDISNISSYSYDMATTNIKENKINDLSKNINNDEKLMEACKEFESYFIQMMYKEMEKTVDKSDSFIKESQGEKIFKDLLIQEQSKSMAFDGRGIGLAEQLYKQMT